MIIARLNGQLGNQMFVYATAYALAKEQKDTLTIFKYEYDTVGRGFKYQLEDLQLFSYNRYWGAPISLYAYTTGTFMKKIFSRICGAVRKQAKNYTDPRVDIIRETDNLFMPISVSSRTKVHLLEGFWQSPAYFDQYRADIVRQYQPNFELCASTKEYIQVISDNSYSVAIHVRRGDYVKIGWCIPMEYYHKAVDMILEKHPHATFFVFSDDLAWAKDNLKLDQRPVVYVVHNQKIKPFEDIWLMSKCNANIIANSSFSWWGAYLNQHPDKIVIAPSGMRHTNNRDVFCQDWIVVDTETKE